MPEQPRLEYMTQERVIRLFTDSEQEGGLGYCKLGDWRQRDNNRNIEPELLRANLQRRGVTGNHTAFFPLPGR